MLLATIPETPKPEENSDKTGKKDAPQIEVINGDELSDDALDALLGI